MPKSHIRGETLDDVMRDVYQELISHGEEIKATKGDNLELTSVLLEINNPRARLSRTETRGKPFSCLGELCWYLAGSNDVKFISYYLKNYRELGENGIVFGAYGPRLFHWNEMNQYSNVVDLLKRKPHSRRAVIQLFEANDLSEYHEDVPCTCSLQFMIRNQQLNLHVSMRSNDAYFGLAHDVFCLTMLQEIMARDLSVELGRYVHVAGSLHLYKDKVPEVRQYLEEGWQSTKSPMPPMPQGNPWPAIKNLIKVEEEIRSTGSLSSEVFSEVDPYWGDLIRLLQIFRFEKEKNPESIGLTLKEMSSRVFDAYIKKKTPD